jgi:predicted PolB exonuclease-like 3'-5' exonuclease
MKFVTLDVETVAPQNEDGSFPSLHRHEPCVICFYVVDTSTCISQMHVYCATESTSADWEPVAVAMLAQAADRADHLITFNGRCFDMPLLTIRALKYNLDWSWWVRKRYRFPKPSYGNGQNATSAMLPFHVDLQEQIGDYGAARNFGLGGLCRALGLPAKTEGVDGSCAAKMVEDGRLLEVVEYCKQDVLITWHTFVRMADCMFGIEAMCPTTLF